MDDGAAVVVFALCHILFQVMAIPVCFARRTLLGQNMAEEARIGRRAGLSERHGGKAGSTKHGGERPKNL